MQAQPTAAHSPKQGPVRTSEPTEEVNFARHANPEQGYSQLDVFRAKDSMDNLGQALDGLNEDFGEVLRHELNNPLTGILGNAELLLSEIRRNDDGRLPAGGLQRLETIAALAVRLRETIRRLSQEWEVRNAVPREKSET